MKLLIILFFLLLNMPSNAFTWNDLWLRPDQQAEKSMQKGDFSKAAQQFHDPSWKGVAHYRNNDYEQSILSFSKVNTAWAHYNRGNALAHLGKLKEAISEYNQALVLSPNFSDANYNKKILEELLKTQNKNSSSQNKQNDKQQNSTNQEQSNKNENSNNDKKSSSTQQRDHQEKKNNQQNSDQLQNNNNQQKSTDNSQESVKKNMDNTQKTIKDKKHSSSKKNETESKQNFNNENKNPSDTKSTEKQQATEQWLRQIDDDPGGLLRQKFLRDSQRILRY